MRHPVKTVSIAGVTGIFAFLKHFGYANWLNKIGFYQESESKMQIKSVIASLRSKFQQSEWFWSNIESSIDTSIKNLGSPSVIILVNDQKSRTTAIKFVQEFILAMNGIEKNKVKLRISLFSIKGLYKYQLYFF